MIKKYSPFFFTFIERKFGLYFMRNRRLAPYYRQYKNFKTLSVSYGQLASMEQWDCQDSQGRKIPWYTYSAIEYLSQFDFSNAETLEYGSGNSSVWWLRRCARLTSIEDNQKWFDRTSKISADQSNFEYRFATEKDDYVEQAEIKTAQVVIIDGSYREQCAEFFIKNIEDISKNCSMLIFDNSDWFPSTIKFLAQKTGWVQCDFMGFGSINYYCWATSIFLNPKNILSRTTSVKPICGTNQNFEINSNEISTVR